METEKLAKELYETYCREVGGKAFNGDPLPNWETFRADPSKQKQSDAWVKVAETAKVYLNPVTGGIMGALDSIIEGKPFAPH